MKKILSFVTIAAMAVMVLSCKNEGKGKDEVKDAAEEAVEAVEEAAEEGAEAVKDAAKDLNDAAKDAANRAGDAIEKLEDIKPYAAVEVKPTFNGGDDAAFVKYLQQNIKYPQSALDKVVKGVSEALDAEALRVIESAPDWTPAKQDGKNVPVTFTAPVTFAIK